MTPEYFASLMRLVLLVCGAFWVFTGFLMWLLRGVIEDGDTFLFWLVLSHPYIRSAEGRLQHAMFASKMLLLFGVPTLFVAVFLPDPIFQEFGSLGTIFIIFASVFLKLVFVADAQEREARYGKEDVDEAEAERIRKLEEEGKLRD